MPRGKSGENASRGVSGNLGVAPLSAGPLINSNKPGSCSQENTANRLARRRGIRAPTTTSNKGILPLADINLA